MAYKMKGSGKVYYEGSGAPINLNPKDLGEGYLDEFGNKAYDHKKTGDVFYEKKPRGGSPWEKKGGPSHNKPIIPPPSYA